VGGGGVGAKAGQEGQEVERGGGGWNQIKNMINKEIKETIICFHPVPCGKNCMIICIYYANIMRFSNSLTSTDSFNSVVFCPLLLISLGR
jgi:hypothetical protein